MIAIALAGSPRLLIADEATTALDVTTQAQIMDLLLDLQERYRMGLILISHDMGLAASYAQTVMVMYAGQAVERAPVATLFTGVRMPYTKVLLDAVPRLELPPHSPLPVVSLRAPDLVNPPPGCPFAPRCPRRADDCTRQAPDAAGARGPALLGLLPPRAATGRGWPGRDDGSGGAGRPGRGGGTGARRARPARRCLRRRCGRCVSDRGGDR